MRKKYYIFSVSLIVAIGTTSCDEFVKIDPPRTDLVRSSVFTSDGPADAAVADLYFQLKSDGFASGNTGSLSILCALSSDEMIEYNQRNAELYRQFNENTLQANNQILNNLWANIYLVIYKSNAIIEGLRTASGVTESLKQQLEGEAKFIRAFGLFYAVNLWGDIPLTLTTDYRVNNSIARSPANEVYVQIVKDLVDAQNLLANDYSASGGERVRANAVAATALLARAYLYMEDWQNAELQASKVIENTSYSLGANLATVFRTTSSEAILQFWSDQYPNEFSTFLVSTALGPNTGALRPEFVADFESGDLRSTTWVRPKISQGVSYLSIRKYVSFDIPPLDYSTVLRLAEQYLIRAEARVHLNKLTDGASDLNVVRNRSGLAKTTAATQVELLNAVIHERKVELFAEWGHRWFDLKRTHQADVVLGPIKPQWSAGDALYPIPESQMISDPAVIQNPN